MHHPEADLNTIWKKTGDGEYKELGEWGPKIVVKDSVEEVLSVPMEGERAVYTRKPGQPWKLMP